MRQCKFLVNSIDSVAGFPPLTSFPRAQLVTFRYYTGVLSACEDSSKAREALDMLSEALRHCHVGAATNLRLILRMLVPVALLAAGRAPPRALLQRHGLDGMFADLVDAFCTGNIRL